MGQAPVADAADPGSPAPTGAGATLAPVVAVGAAAGGNAGFDPFPAPHLGLAPTHAIDWPRIAERVVRGTLALERGERVIVSADPYFGGAALDAFRAEIQRAKAVELATILHWTPALAALRDAHGRHLDADVARAETAAMRQLFAAADVFVLLMNDRRGRRTVATSQSDEVVDGWAGGRAVHLHWFHDPAQADPAHPLNRAHDRVNERAVVELDVAALRARMEAMAARLAGREMRIRDPRGTDLRLVAGTRFHLNYGDASKARMASMTRGRDREEEVPAGSFRFIPEPGSASGRIVFPRRRDGESPALGRGFDPRAFADDGLAFEFADGEVTGVRTDGDQAALDRAWAAESGDKGRLGEVVLGCNPLLVPVPGSSFQPHYGFGAGVVRLILGDNALSGGTYRSSFHRWLMWSDATVEVGGRRWVDAGRMAPVDAW